MNLTHSTHYSSHDGGYYAEIWDAETGRSLRLHGNEVATRVFSRRHKASKQAKKIIRSISPSRPRLWALALEGMSE